MLPAVHWAEAGGRVRPNPRTQRLIDYSRSSEPDRGGLMFVAPVAARTDHTGVEVWSQTLTLCFIN